MELVTPREKSVPGRLIAPGVGVLLALLMLGQSSGSRLAAPLAAYGSAVADAARRSLAGPVAQPESSTPSPGRSANAIGYAILAAWLGFAPVLVLLAWRPALPVSARVFLAPRAILVPRGPPAL